MNRELLLQTLGLPTAATDEDVAALTRLRAGED